MASTPKAKPGTQRRVYVLPDELVNRILEFQQEKGISSETEAARRLLDDALKSRDSYLTITTRFLDRLKDLRIPAEVAREVLAGHPLISAITFENDAIMFRLKDGWEITIGVEGQVHVQDSYGNKVEWPEFGTDKGKKKPAKPPKPEWDDDVPF
jgi:hypothetical protein